MDARGMPTGVCPGCGGNWFIMCVAMEDGLPAAFLHEAVCANEDCGTLVTLADPTDLENRNAGTDG